MNHSPKPRVVLTFCIACALVFLIWTVAMALQLQNAWLHSFSRGLGIRCALLTLLVFGPWFIYVKRGFIAGAVAVGLSSGIALIAVVPTISVALGIEFRNTAVDAVQVTISEIGGRERVHKTRLPGFSHDRWIYFVGDYGHGVSIPVRIATSNENTGEVVEFVHALSLRSNTPALNVGISAKK